MAVSPGPNSARQRWLKPSFDPRQTMIVVARVEPDAITVFEVFSGHLAAQAQDAARIAVAMVFGIAGGLGQLFDDQILRWVGRVAHRPNQSHRRQPCVSRRAGD